VEVCYCFLSYYPFLPLFYDLLKQLFDEQFRAIRKTEYLKENAQGHMASFNKSFDIYRDDLKNILFKILSYDKPLFHTKVEFNFESPIYSSIQASYPLPTDNVASFSDALLLSPQVFEAICLSDLKWLVSAFLLEQKIIIFSKNHSLLTSTIITLVALIKPLRYTYAVIASMPKLLLFLAGQPLPCLIGINHDESLFWENKMHEKHSDCIYVFLDDKKIYANDSKTQVLKMPILKYSNMNLEETYHKINTRPVKMELFHKKDKMVKAKMKSFAGSPVKYDPKLMVSFISLQDCETVFLSFKRFIEKYFLHRLITYRLNPEHEEDNNQKILNSISKMSIALENNNAFLSELAEGQLFAHFTGHFIKKTEIDIKEAAKNLI